MKQGLKLIEGIREDEPDAVYAWVNVSAITDFFIALEEAIRDAQNKESSRKQIEALIKETFKNGD